MACQSCAERRAILKAWLAQATESARKWAAVRAGHAEQATSTQPAQGDGPAPPTQGDGQTEDAGAEYQQRSVEGDTAASPVEGRVQVPSVRKARSRKGSAR